MPEIPYSPAIEGFSSVFNLTKSTLPVNWPATLSTTGASILHGPHQGAQKSTTTGFVAPSTWLWKVA